VLDLVDSVIVDVTVAFGVRETVDGFKFTVGPFETVGRTVADRDTDPAKFWRLVRLRVELADEPGLVLK
jgi:hypothetical protein